MWLHEASVVPHKNVTKVVWYSLVKLSSLNNIMSMVSGGSVQVSGRYRGQNTACDEPIGRELRAERLSRAENR